MGAGLPADADYVLAILDDHTRLSVGYRLGYAEETVRLTAAHTPGLTARSVPRSVCADNGSALCERGYCGPARNSVCLWYIRSPTDPRDEASERFFRTVREQFLVEVTDAGDECHCGPGPFVSPFTVCSASRSGDHLWPRM